MKARHGNFTRALAVVCVAIGFSFGATAPASADQLAPALAKIREIRAGAVKACATGKKFTIAFSHPVSNAAIVKEVRHFAAVRAKELGCVTVLNDNTQNNNLEQQIDAVQAWVTQGVNAIVVAPVEESALKPLQNQAQAKGIKWLTYLGTMKGSDGFVGFNHAESGDLIANAAVKWVQENHIKDPTALVTTLTGLPSIAPRWTEVERIFKANGIKIVAMQDAADQATGLKVAETVLQRYPHLSVIIGLNDDAAVGANRAVEIAGIPANKIFIGGQDGSLEGLTAVNKGGAYKASSAILINELGANIVDQALNAVAKTGPTFAYTPTVLATKANQPLLDKLLKAYQN